MGVGIGLGCAEFPFSCAAAYWRWIDMCEAGGVDSIWQTDRIVSRQPFLESMATMAALAGRTRRMRFGMTAGQAVRHHRRALGRPAAAGLRHWQPAGARMGGARHGHEDARSQDRR